MSCKALDTEISVFSMATPDISGHFGQYGGRFVAETLHTALKELTQAYAEVRNDKKFWKALQLDFERFVGRPTPIYHAERWSASIGGAQILLKREDLNHTGAHKILTRQSNS